MSEYEEFKVVSSSNFDGTLSGFTSRGQSQQDFILSGDWQIFEDQDLCRAFFLIDKLQNEVAGFFTLSPYALNKEYIPGQMRADLQPLGYYGGYLAGQLSINSSYTPRSPLPHDESLGQILLQFLFRTARYYRDRVGGRFIFAESEYEDVHSWYEENGFIVGRSRRRQKIYLYDPNAVAES